MDVQDITVMYTPVLARQQAEQILLLETFASEPEKVRMPYTVALQVNQVKLKSNRSVPITEPQGYRPKAKHHLDASSIVFHFLHRPFTALWPSDIIQGRSLFQHMVEAGFTLTRDDAQTQAVLRNTFTTIAQELVIRGFITTVTIIDTKMSAKSNSLHFSIGGLTVSLAGDSLKHFMDFCKLVQISMADELKQLEQLEEEMSELTQSDVLAVSAFQRFEH